MLWSPFHLKPCLTHKLPHHETERQQSVNNIWSCILGNQGFMQMNQLITEQLTAFIAKIQRITGKTRIPKKLMSEIAKHAKRDYWLSKT